LVVFKDTPLEQLELSFLLCLYEVGFAKLQHEKLCK